MIDLTTDKAKRQYHNMVLRVLSKLEGTMVRQLKPMINAQYREVAKLLAYGIREVDYVVDSYNSRFKQILVNHYRRVANQAGRNATMAFDPSKSMGEAFWRQVEAFIRQYAGQKITTMQGTSKEMIRKLLDAGIQEGMSNEQIAKLLRKKGNTLSRFQAIRIARTETLGMYNSATEASINDTGLKYIRVWSTTIDQRTRRRKLGKGFDHLIVNGQKRDQETPFDVSGEALMYPGDPKGSAGNIINCRCVLLYERDRTSDFTKPTGEKPPAIPMEEILPPAWDQGWSYNSSEQLEQFNNIGINYFDATGYSDDKLPAKYAEFVGSEIGRMLDDLPKLKKLVKKSDKKLTSFEVQNLSGVHDQEGVLGTYDPGINQKRIYLATKGKNQKTAKLNVGGSWGVEKSLKGTIRHEYGHWVHLSGGIDSKMKSKWRSLLEKNSDFNLYYPTDQFLYQAAKKNVGKKISVYGSTDADEMFAESFSAYTHPEYKDSKKKLPKFIEKFFDEQFKGF